MMSARAFARDGHSQPQAQFSGVEHMKRSQTVPVLFVSDVSKEGVRLRSHGPNFSNNDLILNPELMPNAKVGDTIRIWSPADETKLLLLLVCDLSKVKGNVQLSVSQYIADLFVLPDTVKCEVVADHARYRVDYVVMSVKGLYVGRGEMHKLTAMLHGKPLFLRQTVTLSGLRVTVSHMVCGGAKWTGIVDAQTKVVFRSKSARFFLFMQVSCEMEEFDDEGDLYFEKAVKFFLEELFKRWTAGDYDHALSVVLFSRSFFDDAASAPTGAARYRNGKYYVDYYREVVHMENRADWSTVLRDLKMAFSSFRQLIAVDGGVNAQASEGNFLEAINLALNVFDKHYVDRDLRRTGQQIIVVTAGNGQFDVDPELSRLTKRRLMDGIGCDVVCLKPRPLHAVPFFRQFHADGHMSYNIPSWFYVCYVQRRSAVAGGSGGSVGGSGDGSTAFVSCHVRDLPFDAPALDEQVIIPCDDESQRLPPEPFEATNVAECNPFSSARCAVTTKQTASKRRWINAFSKMEAPAAGGGAGRDGGGEVANPNYAGLLEGINWESITEPASLPLSTDYFPTDAALKAKFTEHPYIMSLIPLENAYDDNPRLMMREMVYQRLVHGYQIVPQRSRMFTNDEAADKFGLIASVCYLSMAQDFQIISFDPLVSPYNVEVKIFHKNAEKDFKPQWAYEYQLWGEAGDRPSFRKVAATFSNDKMNYRLWNVLDRFVAGQISRDAFPLLKYWRIGFILLSTSAAQRKESNQKEIEWRKKTVENFYAFREFLETTKLAKGQPKRDMDLVIPDFALTVTGAPGEVTGGRGRLDASEISALAKRMAIDSSLIKDRRLGLRTYRDAILGSECLDFVAANMTIASREEAHALVLLLLQYGMLLMVKGPLEEFDTALLKLVRVEPNMRLDASARATPPKKASLPRTDTPPDHGSQRRLTHIASQTMPELPRTATVAATAAVTATDDAPQHSTSQQHASPPRFTPPGLAQSQQSQPQTPTMGAPAGAPESFSDSVLSMRQHPTNAEVTGGPTAKTLNKISVVMETSDRYEWLYVAHDPNYHPNRTFFLAVEWTACTGSAVYDFVQLMHRKAKACNLDLIQIPLNFYQLSDPFFTPVFIDFDVGALDDTECEVFQTALMLHSNFLLMQASSFEWVHVSGAIFVTVGEHKSFSWYFNSLLIERDKGGVAAEARALLVHFRATVRKYQRALAGERVLTDAAESAALLSLIPLSTARAKIEQLLATASIEAVKQ